MIANIVAVESWDLRMSSSVVLYVVGPIWTAESVLGPFPTANQHVRTLWTAPKRIESA
jgi:hypothetical protein